MLPNKFDAQIHRNNIKYTAQYGKYKVEVKMNNY